MNGEYRDNIDNWADWEDYDETLDEATRPVCVTGRADCDEMTDTDWDRYSREFEARYNGHLRSIKSSSPCRVGRSTASRYYDEEDGLGNLLPTEEEINRYRRSLMPDASEIITSMVRPHEDSMAAFFLESQW